MTVLRILATALLLYLGFRAQLTVSLVEPVWERIGYMVLGGKDGLSATAHLLISYYSEIRTGTILFTIVAGLGVWLVKSPVKILILALLGTAILMAMPSWIKAEMDGAAKVLKPPSPPIPWADLESGVIKMW